MNSYFFKITEDEMKKILEKHKKPYVGYTHIYDSANEGQLFEVDYAKDKKGVTLKNEGKSCPDCGGELKEKKCKNCGYKVKDLNKKNKFDYTEEKDKVNESVLQMMKRMKIL